MQIIHQTKMQTKTQMAHQTRTHMIQQTKTQTEMRTQVISTRNDKKGTYEVPFLLTLTFLARNIKE